MNYLKEKFQYYTLNTIYFKSMIELITLKLDIGIMKLKCATLNVDVGRLKLQLQGFIVQLVTCKNKLDDIIDKCMEFNISFINLLVPTICTCFVKVTSAPCNLSCFVGADVSAKVKKRINRFSSYTMFDFAGYWLFVVLFIFVNLPINLEIP